jgi:hypothetical protein
MARREQKAARKVKQRRNANDSKSSQDELSLRSILEVYKNTLHNVRVQMVLDSMYPAVMESWARLRKQHPLPRVVCFGPLGFCKVGCSFYSEG